MKHKRVISVVLVALFCVVSFSLLLTNVLAFKVVNNSISTTVYGYGCTPNCKAVTVGAGAVSSIWLGNLTCGEWNSFLSNAAGLPGVTTASCCTSHSYSACASGDRYWFDSCAVQEGVRENCACGCTGDSCTGYTNYYYDGDGDGYYLSGSAVAACSSPGAFYTSADPPAATDYWQTYGVWLYGADSTCNGGGPGAGGTYTTGTAHFATYFGGWEPFHMSLVYSKDFWNIYGDNPASCAAPNGGIAQYFVANTYGGFNSNADDCNDGNAAIHMGATEICNSVDDDCDGQVDEDNVCCISHSYLNCVDTPYNGLWWFDSCGVQQDIADSCSGDYCQDSNTLRHYLGCTAGISACNIIEDDCSYGLGCIGPSGNNYCDAPECSYDLCGVCDGPCVGAGYTCPGGVCTAPPVCEGATPCGTYPACTAEDICGICGGGCTGPGYTCPGGVCTAPPVCGGATPCGTYPACTAADACGVCGGGCTGPGYTCPGGVCTAPSVCEGATPCGTYPACTAADLCGDCGGTCTGEGYTCPLGVCTAPFVCGGGAPCGTYPACTPADACGVCGGGCTGEGYTCPLGVCTAPFVCGGGAPCGTYPACTPADACGVCGGGCTGEGYTCPGGICTAPPVCEGATPCGTYPACSATDACGVCGGGCTSPGYTCPGGICTAPSCESQGLCTMPNGDCVTEGSVCTTGSDCADLDFCTWDNCDCGYCDNPPTTDPPEACTGCSNAGDCSDLDWCTDDICNPDGTCSNPAWDCDDGDPGTVDSCIPEGIGCFHCVPGYTC